MQLWRGGITNYSRSLADANVKSGFEGFSTDQRIVVAFRRPLMPPFQRNITLPLQTLHSPTGTKIKQREHTAQLSSAALFFCLVFPSPFALTVVHMNSIFLVSQSLIAICYFCLRIQLAALKPATSTVGVFSLFFPLKGRVLIAAALRGICLAALFQ